MGWRKKIDESKKDPNAIPQLGAALVGLKLISDLRESIEERGRVRAIANGQTYTPSPDNIQFAQFSDCIVVSTAAGGSGMFSLLFEVLGINRQLLINSRLLVRGAITEGLMYHEGSVAFGPALTAAYDLERESSIYPRIIIDPALEIPFLSSQLIYGGGQQPVGHSRTIRRSPDGFCFLDFLAPWGPSITGIKGIPDFNDPIFASTLNHVRPIIVAGLNDHKYKTSIWEKYRWLAEYFNEIAAEYPDANGEPIRWAL